MALSGDAQKLWRSHLFSSGAANVAGAQLVDIDAADECPSGAAGNGVQYLTVSGVFGSAAATADILFLWVDDDDDGGPGAGVLMVRRVIFEATAIRTHHDGAGGGYVAAATDDGGLPVSMVDVSGAGRAGRWPRLYAACEEISEGTFTLLLHPGRSL